ncbi:hypothetical protein AUR64_00420 [Haloprofundus marisrubri]|uniref:Uncharacterized protein n=1 Tax=Haloprofundus marisrubri TaxID=1514971 RepID=A0A0W1R401_9EURY|nr:hypothetical protein [Haloprofundus marisrubri]KTG08079.1 hypothetical protein AUR64_00420 [Haloprofundus marisrubri]
MRAVLNERTETVHKFNDDHAHRLAVCGALFHVSEESTVVVDLADTDDDDTSRCGRCFDGAGGY